MFFFVVGGGGGGGKKKNAGGGVGGGGGGQKTKRPGVPKSPRLLRPCPLSSPSRAFQLNSQLSNACTKTKTCNMKHIAFNLTIPTI